MLHILLTILKIIGIILASILGLILLLLLIVLFVPIRYRVSGVKTEDAIDANGRVSWLFGALGLNLFLKNEDFSYEIRIFGISFENIQRVVRRLTSKKDKKKKNVKAVKAKETIVSKEAETAKSEEVEAENDISKEDSNIVVHEEFREESSVEETVEKVTEESTTETSNIQKEKKSLIQSIFQAVKTIIGKICSMIKAIWNFPGKLMERMKKIHLTIGSVCDKIKYWIDFLKEETTKEAISLVKTQTIKVLKHILPKKVRGNVTFGFDDPATTGQVLGGICVFYPLYYKQINIFPDFTQNILLGDIELKGRVYICFLVITALKVYFNKNIQHILKTMKK